jgi:hypothetical protein
MDGFAQRRNDVLGSGHRRAYLECRRQTICVGIDNLCHALLDAAEANIPVVRAGAPHVFVATIYATDSSASINGGMAENVVRLGFGPFNGFGIFPCDHREFRHKCPLPARAV